MVRGAPGSARLFLRAVILLAAINLYCTELMAADGDFQQLEFAPWEEECGACHLAFAPGMLPARSWRRMMSELRDHFGADASIGEQARQAITEFLESNAADSPGATLGMQRIARSIPRAETPLRITETPMFGYYHDEIAEAIWRRETIGIPSNCPACHTRAGEGRYVEWEIAIPKE